MLSPFPGMDPYLESPDLWPDVHHELISQIRAALTPRLRPNYVARVELRVYVADDDADGNEMRVPDLRIEKGTKPKNASGVRADGIEITEPLVVPVPLEEEIEEAYLAIKDREGELVTVIEVLSPTNKVRNSAGRKSFLGKRREVFASDVHWVEIDLLRKGERKPRLKPSDYRVLVSHSDRRGYARYWPITLREKLPIIGIPLRGRDPDAPLELGAVLDMAYDSAAYDVSIDYGKPPTPPLNPVDAKWANQLLREKGLR
jgi:hypothetical protein